MTNGIEERQEMSFRLRISIRERVARRLANYAAVFLARRILQRASLQICCFPRDVIGRDIVAHGLYEDLQLRCLFERAFSSDLQLFSRTVALDVGANIGNHTCWFAGLFSKVLAFEPIPLCGHMLKANLLTNGFSNVDIFQVALSDRNGVARLQINRQGNLGASRFATDDPDENGRERGDFIDVEVARGDDLLRSAINKGERISMIKIDVEGHEHAVLRGLKETIQSHKPIVMFESFTASGPDGSHAILDTLASWGLGHVYVINANFDQLSKLPREFLRLFCGFELRVSKVARPSDRFHSMIVVAAEPLS